MTAPPQVVNRSEGNMEGVWPMYNDLAPGSNCSAGLITALIYDATVGYNIGQDNHVRHTIDLGHNNYGLIAALQDWAAKTGQQDPFKDVDLYTWCAFTPICIDSVLDARSRESYLRVVPAPPCTSVQSAGDA